MLYQRSLDDILLKCIVIQEIQHVMNEVHVKTCGAYQISPNFKYSSKNVILLASMIVDCINYALRCQVCQYPDKFIQQSPEPLRVTIHYCPFMTWRMDIIDPLKHLSQRLQIYPHSKILLFQVGRGIPRSRFHQWNLVRVCLDPHHIQFQHPQNNHSG